jgi:hypothetical protein
MFEIILRPPANVSASLGDGDRAVLERGGSCQSADGRRIDVGARDVGLGLTLGQQRGVRFGRPRKLTPHQRDEALHRLDTTLPFELRLTALCLRKTG